MERINNDTIMSYFLSMIPVWKSVGIRNVNCGDLRGIGKTTFISRYIYVDKKPFSKDEDSRPAVIICRNLDLGRQYRNLLNQKIICKILSINTCENFFRGKSETFRVYSDNCPGIENLIDIIPNCEYKFGMY